MTTDTTSSDQGEVQTSRLVVWRNILAFESTVLQISNISTVAATDVTTTHHFKRSWWPFLWVAIGISLFWLYNKEPEFKAELLGLLARFNWPQEVIAGAAIVTGLIVLGSIGSIIEFKSTVSSTKTFLLVEMNSGRKTFFVSSDKQFIVRAATAIMRSMSREVPDDERVVLNFDQRSINIEKAENSNIIGGNVSNSVVNSI